MSGKRRAQYGESLSTYVSPADAAELRRLADEGDRTVAAELRRAIRAYLAAKSD